MILFRLFFLGKFEINDFDKTYPMPALGLSGRFLDMKDILDLFGRFPSLQI